jgi:Holliday junction resolvase RusA-like endonuclease
VREFFLPVPPPLSACFKNVRGVGRVKSKRYRSWCSEAGWTIKQQQTMLGLARVKYTTIAVLLHPIDGSDIDNRFKPVLDLLKQMGEIEDDSYPHVLAVFGAWRIEVDKSTAQVILMENAALVFPGFEGIGAPH